MKAWDIAAWVYAAVAVLVASYFVWVVAGVGGKTAEIPNKNWDEYYDEVVSEVFVLPKEAKIEKAKYTEYLIMGYGFEVEFRLSSSRDPSEWISMIARESGFPAEWKETEYWYKCGDDCDLKEVRYYPERDVFVVRYRWD